MKPKKHALHTTPPACVILDDTGALMLANGQALALLALTRENLGRSLGEMLPAPALPDVYSLFVRACTERRVITRHAVEWPRATGEPQYFDITVTPLYDSSPRGLRASVTFLDVTRHRHLQEALLRVNSDQELQALQHELQAAQEELEITREELQVEKEELQSSNEELQVSNEELRATMQELQVLNQELCNQSEIVRKLSDQRNTMDEHEQ